MEHTQIHTFYSLQAMNVSNITDIKICHLFICMLMKVRADIYDQSPGETVGRVTRPDGAKPQCCISVQTKITRSYETDAKGSIYPLKK